MKKKIAVLAGIVVVMFCAFAHAQTNLVNYQGELTDAEGKVLATGNYKIKFSIFTGLTGGTAVWTETHATVPVANGHFNVILGNSSSIEKAFVGKETYLEISVGDDAPISPRQRILSVPYAINGCPAGTINAFAGTNVPAGWLPCDGRSVSKLEYPMLFEAIGTAWGNRDGDENTFNLPDLRGLFLRGLNGVSSRDPDASGRTGSHQYGEYGSTGNSGNAVGSFQNYATATPINRFITGRVPGDIIPTAAEFYILSIANREGAEKYTVTGGDKETRPINVYVNYIIKY